MVADRERAQEDAMSDSSRNPVGDAVAEMAERWRNAERRVEESRPRVAHPYSMSGDHLHSVETVRDESDISGGDYDYEALSSSYERMSIPSLSLSSFAPMRVRRDQSGYGEDQQNNIKGNVEVTKERKVAEVLGMSASYPTISGHPLVVGTGLAGIEIELEGVPDPSRRLRYWEAKSDGSLRNDGIEYVCSSPWGGLDLYNAIVEVDTELHSKRPNETWRCSTHVHIDVRDLTIPQLKRMILAYIFYERTLFRCSGFHRYKNNFCVAIGFAQEMVNILSSNWEKDGRDFVTSVASSWDKYTALNILPILTFGSLEFRISEAKWRKGKLVRLANRFLSLKEVAKSFEGSDSDFIEHLMCRPVEDVVQKGLPKAFAIEAEDIEFGAKLAFDVISIASLRKKGRKVFAVDLEDGSEVIDMREGHSRRNGIWSAAADHCKVYLRRNHDMIFPDDEFPEVFTMEYLCRLKDLMEGSQWGDDWFIPVDMSPRQFREYYSEVYSS